MNLIHTYAITAQLLYIYLYIQNIQHQYQKEFLFIIHSISFVYVTCLEQNWMIVGCVPFVIMENGTK